MPAKKYIRNPKTGRLIQVGGATHRKLIQQYGGIDGCTQEELDYARAAFLAEINGALAEYHINMSENQKEEHLQAARAALCQEYPADAFREYLDQFYDAILN